MTVFTLAAENLSSSDAAYLYQLGASIIGGFGYSAAFLSSKVAERAAEDALAQIRFQEQVATAIKRAQRGLQLLDEMTESPPEDRRYTLIEQRRNAVEEISELEHDGARLAGRQIGSAIRSRRWADWMLFLMVIGVAGGTALAILHLLVSSALIYGIAPTAFFAYLRLKNAVKDASDMAYVEKMRLLEHEEKKLELEHKRQDLELIREAKRLEISKQQLALLSSEQGDATHRNQRVARE